VETGSNVSLSVADEWLQWLRIAHVMRPPSPIVRTKKTTTPITEERTVRNFIHSDLTTSTRV
jgi:hypothetical protein